MFYMCKCGPSDVPDKDHNLIDIADQIVDRRLHRDPRQKKSNLDIALSLRFQAQASEINLDANKLEAREFENAFKIWPEWKQLHRDAVWPLLKP
ncbi:hypothetical protein BVRB_021630, partial [Beta vulgaris subsp. vulgaris]